MSKEIEGGYADKSLIGSQIGAIPSAAVSNQFLTGLNTDGSLTRAQPSMAKYLSPKRKCNARKIRWIS